MSAGVTAPPRRTAPVRTAPDEVRVLALDDPRWEDFVACCPRATPFHHPAWARVLADAYGYRAFAVMQWDTAGGVLAGAPFLEVRTLSGRRRWVSLPFTDACPVLAPGAQGAAAFAEALAGSRGRLDAPPIELRADVTAVGWQSRADAVEHVLDLVPDLEGVRDRFSRSQVLRNIRRAEREGVVVRRARDGRDLDAFYALHTRTRRRQGVPVQPRRFFTLLWREVVDPGLGSILLAEHDGTPLAGALFLHSCGTTVYKFGASDPDGWPRRPNHLLFWEAVRESVARGDRRFDFGRTELDNAGLRAFKRGWGAQERPLVTSMLPGQGGAGSPASAALALAIRRGPAWLCVATGRLLYRYAGSR